MINIHQWLQLFIDQVNQTTLWEWLAVILGIAEVLLAKINNIWLYPTGIAGTVIGIYILMLAGLYAESALSVYYIVMSVYGWVYWIRRRNEPPVKITRATKKEWLITLLIVMIGWVIFYVLLTKFTTSNVPVWDAWVSSTAWAGMWLLARRKLENWIMLNLSNLFAIPLLCYKHLIMFAMLTSILFIVAIFGFFEWRDILKKDQPGESLLTA
ncbi:nicotinamide riboside transporter PnuC [Mucilaginibacter sp. UR6-11]|uniref:nicotinamide riboside transporter PnuC n=1 Tax=Mucilaginibacter sp. UR6-11 TaxID=1435644 RepID=UPI001E3BF5B9|nr:nicotinamide riboside transporter PnuC [Mucilaginibacter sp. UR6-11]MCC8424464.1 nicotinamide riboside transporter PnuC [Mucilaginibacter sp. UR6-11]